MIYAKPATTHSTILDKSTRTIGIQITPQILAAVKECLATQKDIIIDDNGYGYVWVRPITWRNGLDAKYENTEIMVLTGIKTFTVGKGDLGLASQDSPVSPKE